MKFYSNVVGIFLYRGQKLRYGQAIEVSSDEIAKLLERRLVVRKPPQLDTKTTVKISFSIRL